MIRVLFGSALPVLGLGLAAAIVGPNLVVGPRGEPIIMAAPSEASLQAASFDGKVCAPTVLFAGSLGADAVAGAHIVAFALRTGERGIAIEVEDFPGGATPPKTIVLVFDETGRLISLGDPEALRADAHAKGAIGCADTPDTGAPI